MSELHQITDAGVTMLWTGRVQAQPWGKRPLSTAAVKTAHHGASHLGFTGFVGDEQGDLKHHGGPDKAVCCYPQEFYDAWRDEGSELREGAFSENLTIRGATDEHLFLGDVFRVGGAVVQVTQPRQPCSTLAKRWGDKGLVKRMMEANRCGYYLRVLEEGEVSPGDAFELVSRMPGAVSVAQVSLVMNGQHREPGAARALLDAPEFPDRWRAQLERRLSARPGDES